jgi:guanylate kinase
MVNQHEMTPHERKQDGSQPIFERTSYIEAKRRAGLLIIVTGATAAGKTSIITEFLNRNSDFSRVVTSTTRKPRSNERPDIDYHFLSEEEFIHLRENHELIEETIVVGDDGTKRFYGTAKKEVERVFAGEKLLWSVDMTRGANLEFIFSRFPPEFANQLRSRTIPILVGTSRLTQLKDRYLARLTGQQLAEKRNSFTKRLRDDWENWNLDSMRSLHVLLNDGELDQSIEVLRLIISHFLNEI